ncbi:MAG: CHAT domain-containing protein [Deltaproteobacteria bacterium]|nr:CHAT domain-containing protein [Deltaproteobacteria bacterium]
MLNRWFRNFAVMLVLCPTPSPANAGNLMIAAAQQVTSSNRSTALPAEQLASNTTAETQRGDFDSAAATHLEAAEAARTRGDSDGELRHRVLLAEARQAQGRYADAAESLSRAIELAEASEDVRRLAAVRGALGNVLVALGADDAAERELSGAASLAREAGAVALAASLGNNLGNYFALRSGDAGADAANEAFANRGLEIYARALRDARAARDHSLAARILANHARLALGRGQDQNAKVLLEDARQTVARLAPSHENILTRVHIGRSYKALFARTERPAKELLIAVNALLVEAVEHANQLGDAAGAAWAQGTLGGIYADRGHTEEALELVRRALFDAQRAGATDAELRFEIESARLLAALGQEGEAIEAYRLVVERLAELRPALRVSYAADEESIYREAGRAYREMVDLLLQRAARKGSTTATDLAYVQQLMERFKADELRDYFQDDCVDAYRERFTGAGDAALGAIVVYPIVLEDRLEILLTLDGVLEQYTVAVSGETLNQEIRTLRKLLEKRVTRQYLPHAQRAYERLVRPYQAVLERHRGATVVFVPDGVLRTIPMAALHDGEKFLIERHPVATTPSLELSDPHPMEHSGVEILLGGLAESTQGFASLPYVRDELSQIGKMFGSEALMDEAFVETAIATRISDHPYSIVHLASHGQIGARAEDSYVLTHDGKIELGELSSMLAETRFRDQPLELLALSACETAAGDERAALGLSGLAVRAGARSVLGTLWKVNDVAASKLMVAFYRELTQPGTSRASALRRAQMNLLEDRRYLHPGYWSPFLIISNWL